MGVQERREREKKELKQEILDAARDLFVREGFENVSMRKIAEKIEYSPTAIYLHFKDKEALVHELCLHDFRVLLIDRGTGNHHPGTHHVGGRMALKHGRAQAHQAG